VIPLAISGLFSLLFVISLNPVAHSVGLVDRPGGHKRHARATSLLGGISIFLAVAITLALDPIDHWTHGFNGSWLLAGALIIAVGTIDDLRVLGVHHRFSVQIASALIVILLGGVVIEDLGNLLGTGTLPLGWLAIPFTVFAIVGAINAINLTDGMDGLAGGIVLLSLLALAGVATQAQGVEPGIPVPLLAIVIGALLGFLALNVRLFRHRALTFLGDGGSTFLGLTLACFLIAFAQGDEAFIEPVTALWFLGLPLIDTLSLMIRRLLRGASPFSADRHHLHHLLCRARLRVNTTLVILLLGHGLLVLVGLAGVWLDIPGPLQFYAFLAVFAGYYVLVSRSSRLMRWLHRARRQIVNGHGILRGLL